MRITASCRHIDGLLHDQTVALVETLKSECACTDQAIQTFRECMYRHGGSIIKYAHNVLRCNNHDNNTQPVVSLLMLGGDESNRDRVYAIVRQYMDIVCEYTDSYEY